MVSTLEIARYLIDLSAREPEPEYLSQMRLHKLLYYVQGWSLALRQCPMFPSTIEAWQHGPVVRDIRSHFKDYGDKPILPSDSTQPIDLSKEDKAFIGSIWESYKQYSASALRQKTHCETPWLEARGECDPEDRCDNEISQRSMMNFFRSIWDKQKLSDFELSEAQDAADELRRGEGIMLEDLAAELGYELPT